MDTRRKNNRPTYTQLAKHALNMWLGCFITLALTPLIMVNLVDYWRLCDWLDRKLPLLADREHGDINTGKCITCRFNDGLHCTAGSYYADMGLNRTCYEGELYESGRASCDAGHTVN